LQVVIELPYALAQDILYAVIVYSMIGFEWTVAKFFWYLFFGYFTLLYFTFYGMMTVGLTPNYHIAAIVSAAFYAIWNLFSGFVIPRPVRQDLLMPHCNFFFMVAKSSFPFLPAATFRKCRSGGGGTAGYAPWRGRCTGLWCHSTVTS
jgi:hypothetical protein